MIVSRGRSFTKIRKRSGTRTRPWGTTTGTGFEDEIWLDRAVTWLLLDKYDLNQFTHSSERPTVSSVFRGGGGGMRPWPLLGKSENIFWRDTLLKIRFQTYIFCSKVSSKCRKCRFRDPNFKMRFQTYILLKSALKMQEMPFQRPKFQTNFRGGDAPGPPYNCVVTMTSPSLKSWLRHCLQW